MQKWITKIILRVIKDAIEKGSELKESVSPDFKVDVKNETINKHAIQRKWYKKNKSYWEKYKKLTKSEA